MSKISIEEQDAEKYAVRLVAYQWAADDTPEERELRFTLPPVRPPVYLNNDVEAGSSLGEYLYPWGVGTLFEARSDINDFQNADIPKSLATGTKFETLKFEAMTGAIGIDTEGQITVQWADGELFIEIVEVYEAAREDAESYKVAKVLARWEVLAHSAGEAYFPPWEMDAGHQTNKELREQAELLREATPFMVGPKLKEVIIGLLNDIREKPFGPLKPEWFHVYGMQREHILYAQIICDPTQPSGLSGSHLARFATAQLADTDATIGVPVKIGEIEQFFQTSASMETYHQFVEWFNRINP